MRSFHAPPVGAVINRRGPGGRMGRRPAASGFSAPAGGLVQRDAPPISLLVLPKEKRAVHGPKRKALGRNFARACKVAVRGRRERVPAGSRWRSDGRGGVRCKFDNGFPRRGCVLGRVARTYLTSSSFRAFRFATRCPGGRGSA